MILSTLALDNSFSVTHNILQKIEQVIMTIEYAIRDEKLQYNINRKAVKISALSSGKINKYKYVTCEKTLPSNQSHMIERTKFTYSSLGKTLKRQKQLKIKTTTTTTTKKQGL